MSEGLGVEAGSDGDPAAVGEDQLEGLMMSIARRDRRGKDSDGEELGDGWCVGALRRGLGFPIEAISEGVEGKSASLTELGLGEWAVAEIAEDGVPACVRDGDVGHGVSSAMAWAWDHGNHRSRSRGFPDVLHRTDTLKNWYDTTIAWGRGPGPAHTNMLIQ